MKQIGKKEFAVQVFDLDYKVIIVYITTLNISFDIKNIVYSLQKAEITHLKVDKAALKIPSKYTGFADIFSPKLAIESSKYTDINNHAIELMDDWQFLYSSIYSLALIELEKPKIYIKSNLITDVIRPFKSIVEVSILFNKKLDGSLRLYLDYWGFKNLTIKNRYYLLLIRKSLDQFSLAWGFI